MKNTGASTHFFLISFPVPHVLVVGVSDPSSMQLQSVITCNPSIHELSSRQPDPDTRKLCHTSADAWLKPARAELANSSNVGRVPYGAFYM